MAIKQSDLTSEEWSIILQALSNASVRVVDAPKVLDIIKKIQSLQTLPVES